MKNKNKDKYRKKKQFGLTYFMAYQQLNGSFNTD